MPKNRLEEIKNRWGEAWLKPNDSAIYKLPDDFGWLVTEVEYLQEELEKERNRYEKDMQSKFLGAASVAYRHAITVVKKHWTSNDMQGHTHTWHDYADCIEKLIDYQEEPDRG